MTSLKNYINKIINFSLIEKLFKILRKNYLILYYHGIIDDEEFKRLKGPNKHLFIPKSNFRDQIYFLKENNIDVISLDELYEKNFKPKKFSVVFTFDDGYKDNLEIAYPILKENNFPFTIYIVPKILIETPWVWWLELWSQLENRDIVFFKNEKINIDTEIKKTHFFLRIKKKIKLLKVEDQKILIKEIFNLQKITDMSKYFLNISEIKHILKDKLVTIGSHSNDHLSLKNFQKKEVFDQISDSKNYLEKTFNINIRHFSYPYGQIQDISFNEHEILKDLKFSTSVTTLDYSYKNFNNYYLERCSIGPNVKKDDFKRKLLGVDRILRKIFYR